MQGAEKGHLETPALPRMNAGYQFSNPTFTGPHDSYRIAPIPDLQLVMIER